MVVIRLSRRGAKKSPKYRVAVADQRRAASGKYLEIVGHYNPLAKGEEKGIELKLERIQHWISQGAQPTKRVKSLVKKFESVKA